MATDGRNLSLLSTAVPSWGGFLFVEIFCYNGFRQIVIKTKRQRGNLVFILIIV